jgi:hypothetical protein
MEARQRAVTNDLPPLTASGELPGQLDRDGYALVADVFDDGAIESLIDAVSRVPPQRARSRRGRVYAVRSLLDSVPQVVQACRSDRVLSLVEPVLGAGAMLVRGILFDKPPHANWAVRWHQDRTIAVRRRVESPGFGPWSEKEGIVHVEPPIKVLESMMTLRIHLDSCDQHNGALRVIAGSHRLGQLDAACIESARNAMPPVTCAADRGSVLAMRPLVLHASSRAESPAHRRVIHLEFAPGPLPGDIEWRWAHPISASTAVGRD